MPSCIPRLCSSGWTPSCPSSPSTRANEYPGQPLLVLSHVADAPGHPLLVLARVAHAPGQPLLVLARVADPPGQPTPVLARVGGVLPRLVPLLLFEPHQTPQKSRTFRHH